MVIQRLPSQLPDFTLSGARGKYSLGETKERIPAFSIPETFRRVPGQDRKWHGGCQPANVVNPCPSNIRINNPTAYKTSGGINYTHWRLPLRLVNDSYTACTVIPTANGT